MEKSCSPTWFHTPHTLTFRPCSSCMCCTLKWQRGHFQHSGKLQLQSSCSARSYMSWYLIWAAATYIMCSCHLFTALWQTHSCGSLQPQRRSRDCGASEIWRIRLAELRACISVTNQHCQKRKRLLTAACLNNHRGRWALGGRQCWMLCYRVTANDFWKHFCPPCGSLSVTTALLVTTTALDLHAGCPVMQGWPAGGAFIN